MDHVVIIDHVAVAAALRLLSSAPQSQHSRAAEEALQTIIVETHPQTVPDVTVTIPTAIAYDALLTAPQAWVQP